MSSASCSALAWAHLRAPSPDGMPFILGDRCPDQACAPGVGDQTDQRPRGRLVADDSSPPGEAAQSAPASPSLSSLWRKCVFQPNHNNTLGGGSEWTRPNEGDTSHHRLKKSERGNQDKIKHVFREQCVAPCVRRRGCKAGRAAALLSGPGRAGFAPPPEAHGAGGTRPAGGGGGPAFRRRCRLLPRWSSPPGARLLGCRVPVAASERWGSVPTVCPLPLCEGGHSPGRWEGRRASSSRARPGWARGAPPPRPHLPGPQEAAPSLDLALRRVAGGGGGRHGTRAGGPSWGPPECLDAEPSVFAFSLSLALSRRRGRRGAPAEGTLAREEGQGHGPSLRDSRSSLYA